MFYVYKETFHVFICLYSINLASLRQTSLCKVIISIRPLCEFMSYLCTWHFFDIWCIKGISANCAYLTSQDKFIARYLAFGTCSIGYNTKTRLLTHDCLKNMVAMFYTEIFFITFRCKLWSELVLIVTWKLDHIRLLL